VTVDGVVVSPGNDNTVYGLSESVVSQCFESMDSVTVRNPTTDGWVGSITASQDFGQTYYSMVCSNCIEGASTETIGVDGDENVVAATTCLSGVSCDLVLSGEKGILFAGRSTSLSPSLAQTPSLSAHIHAYIHCMENEIGAEQILVPMKS
jgi:hypothetical protein